MLRFGFIFIVMVISLLTTSFGSNFSYEETHNKSMSKFQRIGHVENYLKSLQSKMKSFDKKEEAERIKLKKNLEKELTQIKEEVDQLKEQVKLIRVQELPKMKFSIEESLKKSISEQLKDQTDQIEELKKSNQSLELTLKSLIKMKEAEEEVKAQSSLFKKKSP